MKQQSSSHSGRPSSRNGSRRRSGNPRRGEKNSERFQTNNGAASPAPGTKPGLWQRVLALFTGARRPATTPARAATSNNSGRTSSRENFSETQPNNARPSVEGANKTPSRKPEALEATTPRLYVGNLSFDATESDLTELFNGVGRVVSAEIISHRHNQRSKGFAFVQMQSVEEAKRAVEELHDKEFLGRKLFVSGAKSPDQHDGRDEPRFAS